jgi:hypothetical protein
MLLPTFTLLVADALSLLNRDPRAFDNYQPGSPLTANMRQRTPTYADYRYV